MASENEFPTLKPEDWVCIRNEGETLVIVRADGTEIRALIVSASTIELFYEEDICQNTPDRR